MTNTLQFIGENRSWIFDGIAGVILTLVVAYVCYRWQKRERLVLDVKTFSVAYDLEIMSGGFDPDTFERRTYRAKTGVNPAKLKVLCHNLTATPAILDEIILCNADTGEQVVRQDAKALRIDANNSSEVAIVVGSTDAPCYQPPLWRGRITVKTVRKKVFSSNPFNFRDLV